MSKNPFGEALRLADKSRPVYRAVDDALGRVSLPIAKNALGMVLAAAVDSEEALAQLVKDISAAALVWLSIKKQREG